MDSTINKTIGTIQSLVTEQTGNCSKIARQIAFGLTATTWALLFIDSKLQYNLFLLLALLVEIIYFVLDFLQYFMVSFQYKKLFINANKVLSRRENNITDEILLASIQEAKRRANSLSYSFFYWKFPFIAIAFLMVLFFVVSKI